MYHDKTRQGHFGSGYITTKQSSGSVADRTEIAGEEVQIPAGALAWNI